MTSLENPNDIILVYPYRRASYMLSFLAIILTIFFGVVIAAWLKGRDMGPFVPMILGICIGTWGLCVWLFRMKYEFHKDHVEKKLFFKRKQIFYRDIEAITQVATKVRSGLVSVQMEVLKIMTPDTSALFSITEKVACQLKPILQYIHFSIMAKLASRLDAGEAIAWGKNVTLRQDGLLVSERKQQNMIPYQAVSDVFIRGQDALVQFSPGNGKEERYIQIDIRNLTPFLLLCQFYRNNARAALKETTSMAGAVHDLLGNPYNIEAMKQFIQWLAKYGYKEEAQEEYDRAKELVAQTKRQPAPPIAPMQAGHSA